MSCPDFLLKLTKNEHFKKENIILVNKINLSSIIIYIGISISLFIDFFLNLDLSSGGSSADFYNTLPAVINLLNFSFDGWSSSTRHFPLHYFLLSTIYRIFEDEYYVRMFYTLISTLIPILIYLNLKYLYRDTNDNKLLIFSSIILLLPFLRSSIVWSNAHTTGFIFFLCGNLFLQKFIYNSKKQNLFLSILFLSFAVYSVQYYAILFLIFLAIIYEKFDLRIFIISLLFCFITSLPGFYFLKILPSSSDIPFAKNIFNVIMINFSIYCFYLISFLNKKSILLLLTNLKSNNHNKLIIILIILISILGIGFFDYSHKVGGGFFYKFSNIFFGNNYLFYLTSIIGSIIFIYLEKINKKNVIKLLLVFATFLIMTSSYMIFQKYFEPLFILVCLFYLKSDFFYSIFQNKNIIFLFTFFLSYLTSSIIYVTFIF